MPGVIIGDGSVIGANSTVTKSIPPNSIAVGQPAKVIKLFDRESQQWIIIIRKSKFPRFPERSVQFSGKRTKRSVQKKAAHNTYKAGAKG